VDYSIIIAFIIQVRIFINRYFMLIIIEIINK